MKQYLCVNSAVAAGKAEAAAAYNSMVSIRYGVDAFFSKKRTGTHERLTGYKFESSEYTKSVQATEWEFKRNETLIWCLLHVCIVDIHTYILNTYTHRSNRLPLLSLYT